jgi:hypothetical protein
MSSLIGNFGLVKRFPGGFALLFAGETPAKKITSAIIIRGD